MKLICLILSIFLIQSVKAQPKPIPLDINLIPKSINIEDSISHAYSWVDKTGESILIFSLNKTKNQEDLVSGNLNVFYYSISNDSVNRKWRIYEYIKDCPVDMTLYFVKNTFAVTDLNRDGKSEVWIMYKVSCQGDVSPITMKIIMYEDNKKFAVRGSTIVNISANEFEGGKFSFDENFKMGPKEFRKYAESLWDKNKLEKWQE